MTSMLLYIIVAIAMVRALDTGAWVMAILCFTYLWCVHLKIQRAGRGLWR